MPQKGGTSQEKKAPRPQSQKGRGNQKENKLIENKAPNRPRKKKSRTGEGKEGKRQPSRTKKKKGKQKKIPPTPRRRGK